MFLKPLAGLAVYLLLWSLLALCLLLSLGSSWDLVWQRRAEVRAT